MDGSSPKMQLPSVVLRSESPDERQRDTRQQRDKEKPDTSVSLAVSSSYLMDRRYVENHFNRSRDSDMREAWIPDKGSDISTSPKTQDSSLSLSATEFQSQSYWEKPHSRSPFHGRKYVQSALPSSFLHIQKVHFPLRPPLTSAVLSPTCSPCLGNSKMCSPGAREEIPASPYQDNYWACAIPKALPKFVNRNSADWSPNVEYEALLDYTYPIKPGQRSDWDSSQEFLFKTCKSLQDSGIELDQFCSSTSLSGQDFSLSEAGQSRERSTLNAGYRSPDTQLFPRYSDGPAPSFMASPAGSANVFSGALDCCTDKGEENTHDEHNFSTACLGAFTRKVDDEFWPLPEQLSAHLSKQVRDLTAELSPPPSWGSTEQGTTSPVSSSIVLQNQADFDGSKRTTLKDIDEQASSDQIKSRGQNMTFQTASSHREAGGSGNPHDRKASSAAERRKESILGEVVDMVEMMGTTVLSDCHRNSPVDQEDHPTLMGHIQVFCSHLELLIQQLYAVSQRVEQFSAPTEDVNSIRSSLAEYQSFQKELSSHQPLTSSVLHSGQHLLNCINATSPFLRDTLLLIDQQSGVLQTQSDRLFSSIMSAVDTLTQPSPGAKRRENEPAASHKPIS